MRPPTRPRCACRCPRPRRSTRRGSRRGPRGRHRPASTARARRPLRARSPSRTGCARGPRSGRTGARPARRAGSGCRALSTSRGACTEGSRGGRVGHLLRTGAAWSFDQRCVFTRPKPVVLACRGSSAPDLVVENACHVATVGMCPVVAAASVERVLAFRGSKATGGAVACERAPPWSFDLRCVFRRPKPVVLSLPRVVVRPHLVGADPRQRCDDRKRPVDATCTRSQPRTKCRVLQRHLRALHGGAGEPSEAEPAPRTQRRPPGTFRRLTTCRGSSTTKSGGDDSPRSQNDRFWPREYAAQVERPTGREEEPATDAAATTGHIPRVANVSSVLDHQIRRKRPSASQNDRFWPREHAAQVERPTGREEENPSCGRSGDHRAHSDGCQRDGRPRPPNKAETTLGKPKRQVLAS